MFVRWIEHLDPIPNPNSEHSAKENSLTLAHMCTADACQQELHTYTVGSCGAADLKVRSAFHVMLLVLT